MVPQLSAESFSHIRGTLNFGLHHQVKSSNSNMQLMLHIHLVPYDVSTPCKYMCFEDSEPMLVFGGPLFFA